MARVTPAQRTPPMEASHEADRPELKLARAQGRAFEKALE
jgi:hypothetical protein